MTLSTRIRHFIRSNVIGLVAVYLAVGGTALALPGQNTVDSGDIINGDVKSSDIGSGQVKAGELAGSAVNSAKVADESLTGADIADDSLTIDDIDDTNLLVWENLTGIPAGFADGIDNEGSGGPATDLNCTGCVDSTDIGNGQVGGADVGLPLALNGSTDGEVVTVTNDDPGFAATAIRGNALKRGVRGIASADFGTGVSGEAQGSNSQGVAGIAGGDDSFGVVGNGIGFRSVGLYGVTTAPDGTALVAEASNPTAMAADIDGAVTVDGATDFGIPLVDVTNTAIGGTGIRGKAGDSGIGVRALATDPFATGLRATASGANGTALDVVAGGDATQAALFSGDVSVIGTLSKSGGTFKIDHPLDPANKYLSHSFVESPEMKNIYDGIVRTDERGFATVTMPDWFDALNRDFRYQLTTVGRSFARAVVWEELDGERFVIRSNEPRVKVSWLVTGVREDAYAMENPIVVEELKTGDERGRYLYPEGFGEPERQAIGRMRSGRG